MAQRTNVSRVLAFALLLAPWVGCGTQREFYKGPPPADAGQNAGGAAAEGAAGAGASNGQGDCAFTLCNGACVDTAQDVEHCGTCEQSCTSLPHLETTEGVTCSSGVCVISPSACATGYAHCSAEPADGCETDITVPAHCGACDTSCPEDAPFCALGKCAASCPPEAPTACGNSCSDLTDDAMHCGDCEKACAQPQGGGKATCVAGECGTQCVAGYHQCPGTTDCSSDTDASRCGPDCLTCEAPTGGHAICAGNSCGIACDGGLKLCGDACLDTATDLKNCGECGHDCTALPHIGSAQGITCSAGKCVVPNTACAEGYAHCSSNPDDGCETDITQPANCRACGTQCPAENPICTPGGCKNSCAAGAPTLCGGNTCADLTSDANHCGDCATKCTQPASGGTTACEAKKCVLKCLSGYHACGANSCASDADASQCEASCVQCPGTAHGTPKCTNNACSIQCASGYHGCPNDTCASNADENRCEASCKVCPGTANGAGQCSNNKCTVACNSGYHKCSDGTCAADDDSGKCTASCSACINPDNGTAKCSGNVCVTASCKANYHQCSDGTCASNVDKARCTNSCISCPQEANAEAPTCADNACVTVCKPGFRQCDDGKCVDPSVDPTCGGPLLVAGGGVACAIKTGGTVWCWKNSTMATPTQVSGLTKVRQLTLATGGGAACALKDDGSIWCWESTPATVPTDISQQMKFRQVTGSSTAACALDTSNNVYCLNGTWQKKGNLVATHLASHEGTTWARASTDGAIWSWAAGGTPMKQLAPVGAFAQVEAAQDAVVYRNSAGAVVYVGSAGDTAINGGIAVGELVGATTFTQVSPGLRGGCALAIDGRVGCWGYGPYGQLGNGATSSTTAMVQFGGSGFKAVQVARGQLWTCALKADRTVWCAGDGVGTGGVPKAVTISVP